MGGATYKYIFLDGLVCSIVGYFYESRRKRDDKRRLKIFNDTTH